MIDDDTWSFPDVTTATEAHEQLARWLGPTFPDGTPDDVDADMVLGHVIECWRVLDEQLRTDGALPQEWERLSATPAAERAGRPTLQSWLDLVGKGYAPPADGRDAAGRPYWHPATVDAYRTKVWRPTPKRTQRPADQQPPVRGPGGTRDAWATWATARGVTVLKRMSRATIQEECRKAGLIT